MVTLQRNNINKHSVTKQNPQLKHFCFSFLSVSIVESYCFCFFSHPLQVKKSFLGVCQQVANLLGKWFVYRRLAALCSSSPTCHRSWKLTKTSISIQRLVQDTDSVTRRLICGIKAASKTHIIRRKPSPRGGSGASIVLPLDELGEA